MYEYSGNHHGCGCGGDYQADGDALERLARAAESEGCGARQEQHVECGDQHHVHHDCNHGASNVGAGHHGCRCSFCGLVNCVRSTICGFGCRSRRGRNR